MDWITVYSYLRMVVPSGARLITFNDDEPGGSGGYIFQATDEVHYTRFTASFEFLFYVTPDEMKSVAKDFEDEWYRVNV